MRSRAVGIFTARIHYLNAHCKAHRKDHSSARRLQALVQKRRDLLKYLKRTDFPRYMRVIDELGLRDTARAFPTDRVDKYKDHD